MSVVEGSRIERDVRITAFSWEGALETSSLHNGSEGWWARLDGRVPV